MRIAPKNQTLKSLFSLAPLALLALAGCGGGGQSIIGISPATTQSIDAGQTLPILAAVVNDTTGQGATFALTGVGTLGTGTVTKLASSDQTTVAYTAPATVSGAGTATITATSVHTPSQTASVTITINPALVITTTTLPTGTLGTAYTATIATTGGTGTLKFAVAAGSALPAGLVLASATGIITGKPTVTGSFPLSISVTDTSYVPSTVTATYTLVINAAPPAVTPQSLANGVVGTAYSQQLAYTGGGTGTPAFAITAGSLPAASGLTLSSAGLISGTPTAAAAGQTYSFSVAVTVGTQTSPAIAFTLSVASLPVVTTTTLPSGNVGIAYSTSIAYTGGSGGTATFAITTGTLPAGLTLTPAGLISGTPTTAVTSSFSVAVTVGTQTSAPQPLTLVINSLIITSSPQATGEVGLPFSFQLAAAGGTGPYTWSLATGSAALPTGLSLNSSTGLISGTVTSNTGSPFTGITVQAKDTLGATATQAMTFTINPARTAVNNAMLTGQFSFLLTGFDSAGRPLTAAGKFTADGAGNILSGVIDTNGTASSTPLTNTPLLAGTYSVGADNRGKLTLNTAAASSTYVLALDTITAGVAGSGTLTEFDGSGNNRTGVLSFQSPAGSPQTATGYAFGLEGFAANSTAAALTHRSGIGEFQNSPLSAELLLSSGATTTPVVPTATAFTIAGTGRGTLSFTLPNGAGTLNFAAYYATSINGLFLISTDSAAGATGTRDLLAGRAIVQSTTNFTNASLTGISVLHTAKLTRNAQGINVADLQLGLLTFNGNGAVTQVADENQGGTLTTNTFSGTYAVAANGRTTAYLASAGLGGCTNCTSVQTFFYLAAPNEGFVMDFSTGALAGAFDPQTATATATGAYSIGTTNPLTAPATELSGTATITGTTLTGTIDLAAQTTLTPDTAVSSTITPSTTGRITVAPVSGVASTGYVVSATRILTLDGSTTPVLQQLTHQ